MFHSVSPFNMSLQNDVLELSVPFMYVVTIYLLHLSPRADSLLFRINNRKNK